MLPSSTNADKLLWLEQQSSTKRDDNKKKNLEKYASEHIFKLINMKNKNRA